MGKGERKNINQIVFHSQKKKYKHTLKIRNSVNPVLRQTSKEMQTRATVDLEDVVS